MTFREAHINDIPDIQRVRHSVKENVLSDPGLVTDKDCERYLTLRGKGWVCETDHTIVGFAIADLEGHSIWALFVNPEHERKGIGKRLHDIMLDWYFGQTEEKVWLTTGANTRAEIFYTKAGWKETAKQSNDEIRFEMTFDRWKNDDVKTKSKFSLKFFNSSLRR